jgi:glycosyltransferase involved in cell wall biosynthesis
VSIIVPFYNTEKYFRKCLESITSQTLNEIEIILVDDCGTDGSAEIAQTFAMNDDRIKIIKMPENGGRSRARNAGISASSSQYIMFCDSDDYIDKTFCEKMLNGITVDNADMAVCGIAVEYKDGMDYLRKPDSLYYRISLSGLHIITGGILKKTDFSVCNKIFRRDFIYKYDIRFPDGLLYEDAYFFNVYALRVKTIFYIDEYLYTYIRHVDESIMSQTFSGKSGMSIDHVRVAIAIYDYLKKNDLFQHHRLYMADLFIAYCRLSLQYESTATGKYEIYDLAQKFILREKWKEIFFPNEITRQIQLIERNILVGIRHRRILFGIIKFEESQDRSNIYLIGIRVWKIKYSKTKIEHYLLGFLRLFKLNNNIVKQGQ